MFRVFDAQVFVGGAEFLAEGDLSKRAGVLGLFGGGLFLSV